MAGSARTLVCLLNLLESSLGHFITLVTVWMPLLQCGIGGQTGSSVRQGQRPLCGKGSAEGPPTRSIHAMTLTRARRRYAERISSLGAVSGTPSNAYSVTEGPGIPAGLRRGPCAAATPDFRLSVTNGYVLSFKSAAMPNVAVHTRQKSRCNVLLVEWPWSCRQQVKHSIPRKRDGFVPRRTALWPSSGVRGGTHGAGA